MGVGDGKEGGRWQGATSGVVKEKAPPWGGG